MMDCEWKPSVETTWLRSSSWGDHKIGWSHREQTSLVQTQLQEDSMLFYLLYWHSKKFANVFNHCTLYQDNKKDLLTRKDYAAMLRIHVLSDSYKSCCLFQIPLRNSRMWLNKCLLSMWCARKEGEDLFNRNKQTLKKISTKNRMFYSRWLLWAGRREGGSLALGPRGDYNHGGGGRHHHHHWRNHHYHPTMEEEINKIFIIIDAIIIIIQPWRRRSASL